MTNSAEKINKKYITDSRAPFFDLANKYIKEDAVVLDVGCGKGEFAKHIKNPDIHMLDSNPATVQKLSEIYPRAFQGEASDLPYPDSFFDVIHASHVVEHMLPEGVHSFMKECLRCCKEHGYVIISAPLLTNAFYSNLSHIRPYSSRVFINYMCGERNLIKNRTMPVIGGFKKVKLVWRYAPVREIDSETGKNVLTGKLTKTGFTIVLQKLVTKDNR